VLAEAMLFGALPIAYATDGPSFILENFPQQLVPIGNVELLAERLAHFARLEDAESLRAELRTSIETRFSPAVIADQWKELLDS
jgi:glycosyltransferase involved in cell wall biosynthesis